MFVASVQDGEAVDAITDGMETSGNDGGRSGAQTVEGSGEGDVDRRG